MHDLFLLDPFSISVPCQTVSRNLKSVHHVPILTIFLEQKICKTDNFYTIFDACIHVTALHFHYV